MRKRRRSGRKKVVARVGFYEVWGWIWNRVMLMSVGFEKTGERIKKYMVNVEILRIIVSLAFLRDVTKALNIFYKKFLW